MTKPELINYPHHAWETYITVKGDGEDAQRANFARLWEALYPVYEQAVTDGLLDCIPQPYEQDEPCCCDSCENITAINETSLKAYGLEKLMEARETLREYFHSVTYDAATYNHWQQQNSNAQAVVHYLDTRFPKEAPI